MRTTLEQRVAAGIRTFPQGIVLGPMAIWVSCLSRGNDLHCGIDSARSSFHLHVTPTGFMNVSLWCHDEKRSREAYLECVRRSETGDNRWPVTPPR